MKLTVITPQGISYDGEVARVQFRSTTGLMEVLQNHAPMIAELKAGKIVTDKDKIECGEGVVKVLNNEIEAVCE
ncbi:MAG: F0F1 ATP synthase subunit epsilon [Bacteroidaceae bacterium]|nr:F0F1 ATP synthase subunit epsilon [Bacteroidaceae bacterium]